MSEAERLITSENVVAMIGAYQSAVTKTASQETERLKIPFVCSDSSSPTLTERGFKYFFRVSPHDDILAKDQFHFLKDLGEEGPDRRFITSLYFTRIQNSVPMPARPTGNMRTEFGYKVVADIAYSSKRDRRDQRGEQAHRKQAGRADACFIYHRCHPLYQDLQGNGLST